jgi:ketosteroid isomerase-like protein
MELHEVHDCGGNRVLALLHQSGKPHGSDSAVHLEYALVHTVEGGLIHRIEAYATPEAARRAAGLSA